MEGGDNVLYLQLHKLSAINKSQEDLQNLLTNLWKTRKTGLPPHLKSSFQSLLNLPSAGELDPHLLPRTGFSHQVNAGLLPSVGSFLSSETSASLWPQQDEPFNRFSRNDIGASTPLAAETNVSPMISIPFQHDVGPTDNLGSLPRLKSITWTVENRKKTLTNRVAVITLKLQDCSNGTSCETEVKFQLTGDMLEAMLRSMTCMSEQLSSLVGSSTGPLHKKQRL